MDCVEFTSGNSVIRLGQKLYAPTKIGNVKVWSAHVVGSNTSPTATIEIVSQTKLDGKEVVRLDEVTRGKNIGKANETTPFEQALSEAKSRYRKKIDAGYKTEIPTDTSKANDNSLGFTKPMLAKPIDKVKNVSFPAYWQPKLDGHRAIITKIDGKMIIYSRQGKLIDTMDHILDYLAEHFQEGCSIDGELYLHGEMLQDIGSLIKRKREGSERIVFYAYDLISDMPYNCRLEELTDLFKCYDSEDAPAKLLDTLKVYNMEQAQHLTERIIERGYEGGILRLIDKGYEAGFRSRSLLKIKKFDDSEHLIIDIVEGKDRLVNDTALKVAVFVCETPEGQRFECMAHGDQYQKDVIWRHRHRYIGKFLTVKHSGYTKENKPWHPVALRIREDI